MAALGLESRPEPEPTADRRWSVPAPPTALRRTTSTDSQTRTRSVGRRAALSHARPRNGPSPAGKWVFEPAYGTACIACCRLRQCRLCAVQN